MGLTPGCSDNPCDAGSVECGGVCVDEIPADIDSVTEHIFAKSCAFSVCHDAASPAEGLSLHDLAAVRAAIGKASSQDGTVPLIDPGNPDNSYLYRKLTGENITATDASGNAATPMPPADALCEPKLAAVRTWIAAGALTND